MNSAVSVFFFENKYLSLLEVVVKRYVYEKCDFLNISTIISSPSTTYHTGLVLIESFPYHNKVCKIYFNLSITFLVYIFKIPHFWRNSKACVFTAIISPAYYYSDDPRDTAKQQFRATGIILEQTHNTNIISLLESIPQLKLKFHRQK